MVEQKLTQNLAFYSVLLYSLGSDHDTEDRDRWGEGGQIWTCCPAYSVASLTSSTTSIVELL